MGDRRASHVLSFWAAILFGLVIAAAAEAKPGGPAWYCHPRGGSCVAAEAGAKTPYPLSRRHRAWAFKSILGLSAFTSEAECKLARSWDASVRVGTTPCREMSAEAALRSAR